MSYCLLTPLVSGVRYPSKTPPETMAAILQRLLVGPVLGRHCLDLGQQSPGIFVQPFSLHWALGFPSAYSHGNQEVAKHPRLTLHWWECTMA